MIQLVGHILFKTMCNHDNKIIYFFTSCSLGPTGKLLVFLAQGKKVGPPWVATAYFPRNQSSVWDCLWHPAFWIIHKSSILRSIMHVGQQRGNTNPISISFVVLDCNAMWTCKYKGHSENNASKFLSYLCDAAYKMWWCHVKI